MLVALFLPVYFETLALPEAIVRHLHSALAAELLPVNV